MLYDVAGVRVICNYKDDIYTIIDQCLMHPECRKLVYVSSTGAIPERPKGQPIREVDHFDDSVLKDCYSQSKALATQAVLDAVREHGLNG
ncbi:MAG: hypothetical protein IKD53_02355 [Clostridia bacterium]|nr:hypothetical protein [Clostridia bacterium]